MKRILCLLSVRGLVGIAVISLLIAGGYGGHALLSKPSLAASTASATSITPTVPGVDSETRGGGGHNDVRVINKDDNRLRVDGRIQLNHIDGPDAAPYNSAFAYGSCTDCQTFAVALQVNLISRNAKTVAPKNYGVALNYKCTRCTTEADAIQYNITVDDPNTVAQQEKALIKDMSDELKQLRSEQGMTISQVHSRINAVIAQFKSLGASLTESQQQRTDTTTPGASNISP